MLIHDVMQILLSPEALHSWQLQNVLGGGQFVSLVPVSESLPAPHYVQVYSCCSYEALQDSHSILLYAAFDSVVKLFAGDKKSKACGLLCYAGRTRHGHQDRHSSGEKSQRRCDGVLAGMTLIVVLPIL